jgi:hypothetical protein
MQKKDDHSHLFVRDWIRVSHYSTKYLIKHLLSISPLSISSLTSFGLLPSTWQPTLNAVPRISLTPPLSSFESDLNRMVRAISITSSRVIDLLCLMFFSFFRSRGGSFRALMTSEEAEGTTETAACRFWMVSFTVTRRPFCEKKLLLECGLGLALGSFAYPVSGRLCNVLSNLLRGQTKRSNLWSKSR